MKSLYLKCYITFRSMTIFSNTPHSSDITLTRDLDNKLNLVTQFDILSHSERLQWDICNGCGIPAEDAYSSAHLVYSKFGLACSSIETSLSETCHLFGLCITLFYLHMINPVEDKIFSIKHTLFLPLSSIFNIHYILLTRHFQLCHNMTCSTFLLLIYLICMENICC